MIYTVVRGTLNLGLFFMTSPELLFSKLMSFFTTAGSLTDW